MATLKRYPLGKKICENRDGYSAEIPCVSKNLSKSFYLARFSRCKHFCVLQFLQKIRKFKMAAILDATIFFENWDGYSAEILCISKILSKSLYLAQFLRHKHFFVFCNFCENFKMAASFGETNFFENWDEYSATFPVGQKFSPIHKKALYKTRPRTRLWPDARCIHHKRTT